MQITFYGQNIVKPLAVADLDEALKSEQGAIWIDIPAPTVADMDLLDNVFKFHPLAIEDIDNQKQRPKAEEFSDHLFVILNPVSLEDSEVTSQELDIFIGKNYLITVHKYPDAVVTKAQNRIDPIRLPFAISATYLLYVMLDTVVDGYIPVLEQIENDIDAIGNKLIEKPDRMMQAQLFKLKRSLNDLWWIVWPLNDIFNTLTNHQLVFIDEKSQYYLRDVNDHVLRITALIQASRDSVTGLINLYVSAVSNQLNVAVSRLTIFTIVLGMMATIVGFYGMNFEKTFPAFDNPFGVPIVVVMMLSIVIIILIITRRE